MKACYVSIYFIKMHAVVYAPQKLEVKGRMEGYDKRPSWPQADAWSKEVVGQDNLFTYIHMHTHIQILTCTHFAASHSTWNSLPESVGIWAGGLLNSDMHIFARWLALKSQDVWRIHKHSQMKETPVYLWICCRVFAAGLYGKTMRSGTADWDHLQGLYLCCWLFDSSRERLVWRSVTTGRVTHRQLPSLSQTITNSWPLRTVWMSHRVDSRSRPLCLFIYLFFGVPVQVDPLRERLGPVPPLRGAAERHGPGLRG